MSKQNIQTKSETTLELLRPILYGIEKQKKTFTQLFIFSLITAPFFVALGYIFAFDALYPPHYRLAGLFFFCLAPVNIAITIYLLLFKYDYRNPMGHPVVTLLLEHPERIARVWGTQHRIWKSFSPGTGVTVGHSVSIQTNDGKVLQLPVSKYAMEASIEAIRHIAPQVHVGI